MPVSTKFQWAWMVIAAAMLAIAFTFTQATMHPLDDHFFYQEFIETLAGGKLDLSIRGFHGSDFFAVPWYVMSKSATAQIEMLIAWAVALPLLAFWAGRTLFRDNNQSLLFTCVVAMMPFVLFVCLRGWTGPAFWGLMLGSIALSRKFPILAGVVLAFAILTKPFAVALLPLLVALHPMAPKGWKPHAGVVMAIGIPALYVLVQFLQTGSIIIGSHAGVDQFSVWQPQKFFLNLAHALQILFSVHNYYFPDPALTGPGNLMHTTPVLIFLGTFGLLIPNGRGQPPQAERLRRPLWLGILIGIGLNALLDHMDHFYMEAAVLLLIIAAIPMLKRYPLWIPLAIATLHFQWFYFYLQFQNLFSLNWTVFAVPALVDLLFVAYSALHWKTVRNIVAGSFRIAV